MAPIDEGIPIETEVGTLYGIKAVYDADWIVHCHHTDVREVHFHRQVDKAVKPFGMSYARIETRPLTIRTWAPGPPTSPPGPSLRVPLSRANLPCVLPERGSPWRHRCRCG